MRHGIVLTAVLLALLGAGSAQAVGAGAAIHSGADAERVIGNIEARPNITISQVRCLRRVYRKAVSLGSDPNEALGTACGICKVAC